MNNHVDYKLVKIFKKLNVIANQIGNIIFSHVNGYLLSKCGLNGRR